MSENAGYQDAPIRRLPECVAAWPECAEGADDPRCCRFPKACSCTVYDDGHKDASLREGAYQVVAKFVYPERETRECVLATAATHGDAKHLAKYVYIVTLAAPFFPEETLHFDGCTLPSDHEGACNVPVDEDMDRSANCGDWITAEYDLG